MTQDLAETDKPAGDTRGSIPSRTRTQARILALELSLLLFLWSVYGIAINSGNLDAFDLQHAGVEAMVERHQFSLEGSASPKLQQEVFFDGDKPFGDVFLYGGHQYAAKQPGQFMAGAVAYFFLRLFGLSYVNNYLLTSALVTFFTTSLITAVAAVAVFRIAREFTAGDTVSWPLLTALAYGLGTTAFAYSGIAYHDSLASAYLVMAFYLVVLLARRRVHGTTAKFTAGAAGLLLGLTITTSMLPFFMACVLGVYLVSLRWPELTVPALIGGAAGLLPLLLFNAVSFGNPFLQSYIVGGYPESFLRLDLHNSIDKVRFYVSELALYLPIALVGFLGLAFYPRDLRRELLVVLGLLIALAIQVLNIDSHGGCHYGPRFLLPAMPYAALGLIGFRHLRSRTLKLCALAIVVVAGAFSLFANSVGAFHGAMYCQTDQYALWPYLAALRRGEWQTRPLSTWLVLPLIVSVGLFARSAWGWWRSNATIHPDSIEKA